MADKREVEKILEKRIGNDGQIEYRIKWFGYSARYNTWKPERSLVDCRELLSDFEKKRAINILAIEYVNNELAYLVQFRDQNEPCFVNHLETRLWSHLTFDFLVEKIKFDGYAQDAANIAINSLGRNTLPDGTPEIVYVTDMMGGISFGLKYSNGIRFEDVSKVKTDFAELAVAFMEQHLQIE